MKSIERELDLLWSKCVKKRAKNRCEICKDDTILHAHHIFTRTKYGTRWMLQNGVCLCPKCHRYAHENISGFRNFFNPIRIEQLRSIALKTIKWDLEDLQKLKKEYKNYLESDNSGDFW